MNNLRQHSFSLSLFVIKSIFFKKKTLIFHIHLLSIFEILFQPFVKPHCISLLFIAKKKILNQSFISIVGFCFFFNFKYFYEIFPFVKKRHFTKTKKSHCIESIDFFFVSDFVSDNSNDFTSSIVFLYKNN